MIADWIKIGIMIVGFLATIGIFIFQSFVTRQEMNIRFDGIQRQFDGIQRQLGDVQRQLDNAQDHRQRIEDELNQLNQNYIDHLTHHSKQP